MSISEHEQQVLESIESDLASAGPKLAAMLAMFARLTAGEEMPVRERVRRVLDLPCATATGPSARAGRPARPRRTRERLRSQSVWLVCVGVAIALIAWTLTFNHGAGKDACPVTRMAACRQIQAPTGLGGPADGGR